MVFLQFVLFSHSPLGAGEVKVRHYLPIFSFVRAVSFLQLYPVINETYHVDFCFITKTCLFKYIKNFTTKKGKLSDKKKFDIFHISAQNINCGYSLEPPRRGGSNEYPQSMFFSKIRKIMHTPVNPSVAK